MTYVDRVGYYYYYSAIMLTMNEVDVDTMIPEFMLARGTDRQDGVMHEDLEQPLFPEEVIPPGGEVHIVTGIPRWAIEVLDKLYSKDEYAPEAFQHEMIMPDAVFPARWKNIGSMGTPDQ
jgi:hypothetical protein